jgi:CheY-like chemotaxis protein
MSSTSAAHHPHGHHAPTVGAYGSSTNVPKPRRNRSQTRVKPAGGQILLVEDDPDIREFLAFALESEGYQVEQADSAEEGLRRLQAGHFALVLTDYMLPRKTGTTMLEDARGAGLLRSTNAMLITAHPSPRRLAGVDVVAKPIDLDSFLDRVKQMLTQES